MTEVNAHIEHILGIDYETFVKTIILPQGEFSAFLSGDPKEKKDVLSKLLGLEVYRDMMQLANGQSERSEHRRQPAPAAVRPDSSTSRRPP